LALSWAIFTAILLVIAGLVALSQLHKTEPIDYGGITGPGAATAEYTSVDPAIGSDGKRVFFVSMEKPGFFVAAIDISNDGRWPIRIDGLAENSEHGFGGRWPMYLTERSPPDAPVERLGSFWLQPGEYRMLGLQVVIPNDGTCRAGDGEEAGTYSSTDLFDLRTHYLKVVDDTQHVTAPFSIVLVCGDLPPGN
jgi:hypothetical protein